MSAKLMGEVWELDLPQNVAWVLMSLCDHANHDGTSVRPGNSLTAWKTGYSVETVKRIKRELRDRYELIEWVSEGGGADAGEWRVRVENFGRWRKAPRPKRGRPQGAARDAGEERETAKTPVTHKPGLSGKPGSSINRGHSCKPSLNAGKPGSHSRARDDRNRHLEPSGSRRDAGASPDAFPGEPPKEEKPEKPTNWFGVYCERLVEVGMPVSDEDRKRVPGNLARCWMKEGASETEMRRLIGRMVVRRVDGVILSPQEALKDVRGVPRRGPAAGGGGRSAPNSIAVVGASDDDYRLEDYR